MKAPILLAAFLISALPGWAQKPIQLADILSWKRIQAPAVSNDGEWLAYRVSPAEGDAEVVIRNLKTGKELRFPIGDPGAAARQHLAAEPGDDGGHQVGVFLVLDRIVNFRTRNPISGHVLAPGQCRCVD